MPFSKELCAELKLEYGPGVPIFGCPETDTSSGDGSGSTVPTTMPTLAPTTMSTLATPKLQPVPEPSVGPLIPVPEDGPVEPTHTVAIVLSTTIPSFLIAASIGIGKLCEWLDRAHPNEYPDIKRWLRRIGFVLWVCKQFVEFINKCQNTDPEAIPMNPQGQGEENLLFVAFKDE